VVLVAVKDPRGVAIDCQNLLGSAEFGGLALWTRGEEVGAFGEGVNCRFFVVKGLVAVPWDVLVRVGGFLIYIKLHGAVRLAEDGEVQRAYFSLDLLFTGPFYAGVLRVKELEEGFDVVTVDGSQSVICLAEPEQDETGDGGGG
jgi:hypothetical protein